MECPLCRQTNGIKFYKQINGSKIYLCKDCQLALINSQSSLEEVINHYHFEGYNIQRSRFEKNFKKFKDIVLNFKNSGTLLDIGGGYGLYDLMLSENFKVSVIEPIFSQVYLKDIKYKVYKANFDDFQSEQKYDLILMLDILEHFKDPSEALSKAKSFLKKDGILVIQTPNYRSIMQLLVKNWSWWMVEDHKVLFSSQSLSKILKNNCLKKIYFETYEPWIDFKRNLDGNFVSINNSALRKFLKSIFFSLFIPVYFPFRKLIWRMGYGGLIFTVVKNLEQNNA